MNYSLSTSTHNPLHKIIQWNCQGYRAKYEDLCELLNQENPAIVILQETMLNQQPLRPPNSYSVYSDFHAPTPGNGLATLIRRDIPHSILNIQTDLQASAFRIQLSKQYTLCNIYLPPRKPIRLNEISSLIDQLPPPVIVGGDFNSRHPLWDARCNQPDARSRTIENMLLSSPLSILNSGKATHFHTQTGTTSAIDITLCSSILSTDLSWFTLDDLYGSDHYPIVIAEVELEPYLPETRFLEHRADWNTFQQNTVIADYETLIDHNTIDELIEFYNDHIINAAKISIPKSSNKTYPKTVPWWTPECTNANRERKIALRRYQRSKLIADKIAYCRARAIAKKTKNESKKLSWQKYITSININTPMSKIWKKIRKIRGTYQNTKPPYLIKNNQIITDSSEVAEMMASHYETISSNRNYNQQFRRLQQTQEHPINFNTLQDLQYNSPLTIIELKRMLSLCGNSATGIDKISYAMIKKSDESSQNFLLSIMNKIFDSGIFPTLWRTSTVLSFPKPGKIPTIEENYRPISLTSCVGKLMEKIINTRLTIILENSRLIPSHQFGFRKMHSTIDALNKFSTDIINALNQKEQILCVSFDLRKAYDTTWRHGIIKAIFEFGLRGKLPIFLQQFLQNRKIKAKIGNSYSDYHNLEQGVPQGSVLSCTLFSIAISGILNATRNNINAILYVDDLLIYTQGNYRPSMERRIQTAINSINHWATTHGFTFSAPKTNCIYFHQKRKWQPLAHLTINGSIIPHRESIKYLGLIFDYKMTWAEHVKGIKNDCMSRLDILKCLSHTSWGSDRTIMLRLYRAIIRSKLDYGCTIYSSAKENVLKQLEPVHNAAIRLCTGAYRSSPMMSLYAESGEAPLKSRRSQLIMQYYARTLQLQTSAIYPYVQHVQETNHIKATPANLIKQNLNKLNLDITTLSFKFSDQPTWQINPHILCTNHDYPKKDSCHSHTMRGFFNEHMRQHHSHQFPIYTDGAKNETGVGCSAASLRGCIRMKLMPESSIFTAELCGLLCALKIVESINQQEFIIFCDSRSALSITMHYDSTHSLISKIIRYCLKLKRMNKKVQFCWCPSHVDIPGNEKADKMATEVATSNCQVINQKTPYRDWYSIIKRKVREAWSEEWRDVEANKLRTLKETIDCWPSSNQPNRKLSIILTRLRIGHTKLTHQYLMENREQPYCEDCIVPLTVKHVVAECPSFSDIRRRIYPTTSEDHIATMRTILTENPHQQYEANKLLQFIREAGIHDEII